MLRPIPSRRRREGLKPRFPVLELRRGVLGIGLEGGYGESARVRAGDNGRKDRTMKSVLKVSDNGKRVMLLTVLSFIALM